MSGEFPEIPDPESWPESWIGQQIRNITMHVEAGKIIEFAAAVHDLNPVYRCFPANEMMPAPLTFSVVAGLQNPGTGSPATVAVATLGLDPSRVLNGGQDWEYVAPVYAGDILHGVTTVAAVTRRTNKQGKAMVLVTLETEWMRDREPVIKEAVTIIEVAA